MDKQGVYLFITLMVICVHCDRRPDLHCRNVVYNVSNMNQHYKCCQNETMVQQGRAIEELRSQMALLQGRHQQLVWKVNRSLDGWNEGGCEIGLQSLGIEDPGFNNNGFRGSILFKKVTQPLHAFQRVPHDATQVRGVLLVTILKCDIIHSAMYDTYRNLSASISLDSHLRSIKSGSVVAGICVDECVYKLAPANATLNSMGVDFQGVGSDSNAIWFRSSAAFIATKGKPEDAVLVQRPRKQGPSRLTYVIQN